MADLKDIIHNRYDAADTWLENKRPLWTEYENIFHNKLDDEVSSETKSQVFDPKLSTYVLERSYRVMAQLMTGKVKGISKNDEGASRLMNLIADKYIIPNANAQFDFLTKCRMVDIYSNIYGNFFTLIDWDVKPNGYRGPDMWLINIRDVFPQVGALSLDDSDYVIIRQWKPISYFKNLKKQDSYKNLETVIKVLENKSGDKEGRDTSEKSDREQDDYPEEPTPKGKGYYEVLSMYERDRWSDYVVSADEVIRDIKNPHDNGSLPVANKYSIPLINDFMAMGDFERGLPMQYTLNSLWNLYLDAIKMSIFPPVLINKDQIANQSSIQFGPAAKWLVRGNPSTVAQTLNLTPQGIQSFNNTYQVVNSSLLNMFGTSDTSVSEKVDPGFGRTPQALKMQSARENSRDNSDRFYMEQFLTNVMKKFVNLMSKKQSKAIQIRMFSEEIDELSKQYPELQEMYDEKSGKLTINKGKTGSLLYDYEIIPNSTYVIDQEKQNSNLAQILSLLSSNLQMSPDGNITSPMMEVLKKEGKEAHLGELITRIIANSGIQDWDKIITDQGEADGGEGLLNQHSQELQNMIGQMTGQPALPVNEIPPQPTQMPTQMPVGGMNG